jgi:hypothetical protein
MANQGNHGRDKGTQPTWRDVSAGLEAIEKEYAGLCVVEMDVEGTWGSTGALWVRVKLFEGWNQLANGPKHVAQALWPSHSVKEMPSLLVRLIHSVDHMADAQRRAEQKGLPF